MRTRPPYRHDVGVPLPQPGHRDLLLVIRLEREDVVLALAGRAGVNVAVPVPALPGVSEVGPDRAVVDGRAVGGRQHGLG